MICTNCGNEVPDTAKVCGHCGHRLREVQARVSTPFPQPEPTPKKKTWIWIVVALGGILCVLAVVVIAAVNFLPIEIDLGNQPPSPVILVPTTKPLPTATTAIVIQPTATSVPTRPPEPTSTPSQFVFEPWKQGDAATSLFDLGTESSPRNWVVNISHNTRAMISQGWCATTQTILQQNLQDLEIHIFFDGEEVTNSLPWLSWTNNKGHVCRSHRGVIASWPAGKHTVIYQIIFTQKINDGEADYEGALIDTFTIHVSS